MYLKHESWNRKRTLHTYCLMNGENASAGMTQIRLVPSHASDIPPDFASHIYYQINKPFERQGYGKLILRLALKKAVELGLGEIIVCCMEDNVASHNIIRHNGGEFVKKAILSDGNAILKYRFSCTLAR